MLSAVDKMYCVPGTLYKFAFTFTLILLFEVAYVNSISQKIKL